MGNRTNINIKMLRCVVLATMIVYFGCQELSAQQLIVDQGDFILDIRAATNEQDQIVEDEIRDREEDLLELLEDINSEINLSDNVQVIFGTWPAGDKPNAVYYKSEKAIYIGYGLIAALKTLFQDDEAYWFPNVEQTVLHEVGHALIDINNISTYPDENPEVIADQLAFFIMSEFYESEDELTAVVEHYLLRDAESGYGDAAGTSEHMPDFQRGLDYLCWIAGKTPEFAEDFGDALESRDCSWEYEMLVDSWEERLGPSWKSETF